MGNIIVIYIYIYLDLKTQTCISPFLQWGCYSTNHVTDGHTLWSRRP
jgi:hypothetical protein